MAENQGGWVGGDASGRTGKIIQRKSEFQLLLLNANKAPLKSTLSNFHYCVATINFEKCRSAYYIKT